MEEMIKNEQIDANIMLYLKIQKKVVGIIIVCCIKLDCIFWSITC